MANIRMNDLPATTAVQSDDVLPIDGATTRKIKPSDLLASVRPIATQGQAEAGTDNSSAMTPLSSAQAIAARLPSTAAGRAMLNAANPAAQRTLLALGDAALANVGSTAGTVAAGDDIRFAGVTAIVDQATAEAGANNTGIMSPLRVADHVGFNLGITRAQISTRYIPINAFRTTGESAHGDIGAGALYVRGTSGGLRAVQDAAGTWWNLSIADMVNVGWFAANGDGVADDYSALQAALDFDPEPTSLPPTEPFPKTRRLVHFPRGTYLVSQSLTVPAGVFVEIQPGATIRATAAMDAVITTEVDDYFDQHNNGRIFGGGTVDANDMADCSIWLKYFADFYISGITTYKSKVSHIRLGDMAAPARSYGAMIVGCLLRRDLTPYTGNCTGIQFVNCGDSHVVNSMIEGVKWGVAGDAFDSKFDRVHVWNPPLTPDHTAAGVGLGTGFNISGSENVFTQCQVDGPFVSGGAGFYFSGPNNIMVGNSVNHFGSDGTSSGVFSEPGCAPVAFGNTFKGASGSERLGKDFDGDLTGTRLGNKTLHVITVAPDRIAPNLNSSCGVSFRGGTEDGIGINDMVGSAGAAAIRFYHNGAAVGSITKNNSATAFNTSSDERLKEGFTREYSGFGEIIDGLAIGRFRWKVDGREDIGGLAQQASGVYPAMVTAGRGEIEDTDFVPWSINWLAVIPLLIGEVQALRARVKDLEGG